MRLLLLILFACLSLAMPSLSTYELGKKWSGPYPARHAPKLTRVDVLDPAAEDRLGESRRRLRRLAQRRRFQERIDSLMDRMLGIRREPDLSPASVAK